MLVDKVEHKPVVINSQLPIFWNKKKAIERAEAGGYIAVRLPESMFHLDVKNMETMLNDVKWDPEMFE